MGVGIIPARPRFYPVRPGINTELIPPASPGNTARCIAILAGFLTPFDLSAVNIARLFYPENFPACYRLSSLATYLWISAPGMTESAEIKGVLMDKNRMESLTDGIFAFAMTLLVTSMILPGDAVPSLSSDRMLISLLPEFYHYLIAFFVLAAFWMSHHEQFRKVLHIDNNFLYLNITGLFFCYPCPVLHQFYRRL